MPQELENSVDITSGQELAPAGDEPSQGDVLEGVVTDDPGTPCTPEYARELTERALNLADELDDTVREIVRVKAWVPLGYKDPREYVHKELTQSSRPHRYRLARFAAFAHELTVRLGDDALELKLTERALREIPAARDTQVLDALESRLTESNDPEEADEVVNRTLREHSRNAPPPDEDMWDEPTVAQGGARPPRGTGAGGPSDDEGWAVEDPDGDFSDDAGAEPVQGTIAPPSKAALAEADRYEQFLRAMRVIAATGGELPGILDNADGSEEDELRELAERVSGVATATSEALVR
ncbi:MULTISPECIES: hypothetical protein [unclassified Streptomyces]|uniref:hypothetical protein n=1 Tax=unclassified Streptomyces TaxID=2593676 RepID=UPI0037897AD2